MVKNLLSLQKANALVLSWFDSQAMSTSVSPSAVQLKCFPPPGHPHCRPPKGLSLCRWPLEGLQLCSQAPGLPLDLQRVSTLPATDLSVVTFSDLVLDRFRLSKHPGTVVQIWSLCWPHHRLHGRSLLHYFKPVIDPSNKNKQLGCIFDICALIKHHGKILKNLYCLFWIQQTIPHKIFPHTEWLCNNMDSRLQTDLCFLCTAC